MPIIKISNGSTSFRALVDTGSSVNLIPEALLNKFKTINPIACEIPLNTVSGQQLNIYTKVDVYFNIKNVLFCEQFNVVSQSISENFDIILGTPILSKHGFVVDFAAQVVFNTSIKLSFSNYIDKNNLNSVNYVEPKLIKVFAKSKLIIPPGQEVITQVKLRAPLDFKSEFLLISPFSYDKKFLVGTSICKNNTDSLFVKIANFDTTESINISKGSTLGVLEPLVSCNNDVEACNYVQEDEIATLDHTDLQWESTFDLSHLEPPLKEKLANFLKENSDVFASSVLDLKGCSTVPHNINLVDETPIRSKQYRVPYHLRNEMESQLNLLIESKIIIPSTSDFASPVLLVKKHDGGYRLAVDFRKLNKKLIKDSFPIPNLTETLDNLAGAKYFSKMDMTSGFFQQKIRESDRYKTAITTHKGLFEFQVSPFGLATSPNAFQRLMNVVLGDLADLSIQIYIDDIAVASKDISSHFEKLNLVFQRLRTHSLKLKPSKCSFLQTSMVFLGFKIENGNISPTEKNIEVIKHFKIPSSRRHVRSFLGTLNFYRRFLPDFSKRSYNLTNLTQGTGKFVWTQEAQLEFDDLRAGLAAIPSLQLPDLTREFVLFTDASGTAMGAVLAQLNTQNFPCPVAFAS